MVDLMEFIEVTNNLSDEEKLFDVFQAQLAQMGFDRFVYTLATDHPSIGKQAGHGVMKNYPDDWMNHYTLKRYEAIDPVIHHASLRRQPFLWSDMHEIMPYTTEQKLLINESKEAQLFCGVGLGLRGEKNELAAFGFASSEKDVEQSKNTLSLLNLLGRQFHFAYSEIQKAKGCYVPPKINLNLTRQEIDALQWAKLGKSNNDIACIMRVRPDTVKYYFKSIYNKLSTNSRINAIMKAVYHGIITLD